MFARAILIIVCLLVPQAHASMVSVTSIIARAYALGEGQHEFADSNNTSPGSTYLNANRLGSVAETWVDIAHNNQGGIIDLEAAQTRNGTSHDATLSLVNVIFTTTEDTTFNIAGVFGMDGPGEIRADVQLRNLNTGEFLFRDYTISDNTPDESFVIGDLNDGDHVNTSTGSLSGNLSANTQYKFLVAYRLVADNNHGALASGSGCGTLIIGNATGNSACAASIANVPAPASMLVLMGGALLSAGFQRLWRT